MYTSKPNSWLQVFLKKTHSTLTVFKDYHFNWSCSTEFILRFLRTVREMKALTWWDPWHQTELKNVAVLDATKSWARRRRTAKHFILSQRINNHFYFESLLFVHLNALFYIVLVDNLDLVVGVIISVVGLSLKWTRTQQLENATFKHRSVIFSNTSTKRNF